MKRKARKTERGYLQIVTTDADTDAGYDEVDIKFRGYFDVLGYHLKSLGIKVPLHRLDVIDHSYDNEGNEITTYLCCAEEFLLLHSGGA